MNIRYIGHASLCIEADGLTIITDPWYHGSAYCDQWHIFPKPVGIESAQQADAILISHGHEDHLHEPTLRRMPRNSRLIYPYSWYGGIKPYLYDLGFQYVTEAITGRTYKVGNNISITYIANNLDSIIVIEHQGKTLVNINDALHSYHPNVIDAFVRVIRERWPVINTVFCGFGGASYFPNAIHAPGKDDLEIARAREQLFVHNFCHIVHSLSPEVAVPFAADFVLLEPWQRWINTIRFPRNQIAGYFQKYFAHDGCSAIIHDMYPGDVLDDNHLIPCSPYRPQMINGSLDHLIEEQYQTEIARKQVVFHMPDIFAEKLRVNLRNNIEQRARLFAESKLADLIFTVRVKNVAGRSCYNVSFDGPDPVVWRTEEPVPGSRVLVETTSEILRCSFSSEWGGDAITIGYGAELFVNDEATINAGLDVICVRLLTRHPTTTRHMLFEPLRAARFLATNPLTRTWAFRQLRNPSRVQNEVTDRKEWLRRTKCEVCRVCDLPLLDHDFSESMNDHGSGVLVQSR